MALLINNDVQHRVLKMSEAVEAMEAVLKQYADGLACFRPRTDLWSPTASNGDYFRWGSLLSAMYDPPTLAFRFKSDILLGKIRMATPPKSGTIWSEANIVVLLFSLI